MNFLLSVWVPADEQSQRGRKRRGQRRRRVRRLLCSCLSVGWTGWPDFDNAPSRRVAGKGEGKEGGGRENWEKEGKTERSEYLSVATHTARSREVSQIRHQRPRQAADPGTPKLSHHRLGFKCGLDGIPECLLTGTRDFPFDARSTEVVRFDGLNENGMAQRKGVKKKKKESTTTAGTRKMFRLPSSSIWH